MQQALTLKSSEDDQEEENIKIILGTKPFVLPESYQGFWTRSIPSWSNEKRKVRKRKKIFPIDPIACTAKSERKLSRKLKATIF